MPQVTSVFYKKTLSGKTAGGVKMKKLMYICEIFLNSQL